MQTESLLYPENTAYNSPEPLPETTVSGSLKPEALKAQTISESIGIGTGWKIFGGAFLLGGIAAAAAGGGGGGSGRNKETAENPPPSPQPNPPVSAKTDIFYSTGKSQTVSGSLKQHFDAADLEEKGQILKDEQSILTRYTDVKKQAAISKNIEAAYAPDSDKDGVIDAFDKNPNTWDVSERDLRMFATMAYGKTKEQQNGVNQNSNHIAETLKSAYGKETEFQVDFKEELLGNWQILEAYSDGELFGTGADYTVFGNGKQADGSYENVVVAFRGTQKTSLKDMLSNLSHINGSLPSQVKVLEDLAAKIMTSYKPTQVYSTGHSLGGYLAQYFAAHTMQQNDERKNVFKHSALFNPAKLSANSGSESSLKAAVEKSNQMVSKTWVDDSDTSQIIINKHQTDSYVMDKEWVSEGIPKLIAFGITAASVFNPFLLGATALALAYRGLGKYENTTNFTFKSSDLWGKHDMSSFYEKDNLIKETFSKGYRIDKHYLNDDTDKDGFTDFQEKRIGTDFRTATELNGKDTDKDGFSDHLEIKLGSDWQNADKVVEVSEFVKRSEWDKPLFAVAASHIEDGKNEFLGAKGFMLAPTAKGNELTFKADGDGFDLNISASEWQTWLDAGKHIIGGSHEADTLSGSDMASMVFGGKGEDILQAGAAQTVLVGGEGNDTFMFTASNLLSGSLNIINDLSAGDKLDFSDALTLFADRGNAFKWSDVLGESVAAFDNASALIWQDESNTLAYKSGSSNDVHVFARFDDSQNLASIQAALLG